jgi:hypothetical protein
VHDVLYWSFRWELLDLKWVDDADEELHDIMELYGAPGIRADYYRFFVNVFGQGSALPENKREIMELPDPQDLV